MTSQDSRQPVSYARCVLHLTLDILVFKYHASVRQMGNLSSGCIFVVQFAVASFSESLINKRPPRRN